MTDEIPRGVPTEPVFCNDCHTAVRLDHRDDWTLRLVCACGTAIEINTTDQPLPARWSE